MTSSVPLAPDLSRSIDTVVGVVDLPGQDFQSRVANLARRRESLALFVGALKKEVAELKRAFIRRRLRKHKVFGYFTPAEARQRHQHALAA